MLREQSARPMWALLCSPPLWNPFWVPEEQLTFHKAAEIQTERKWGGTSWDLECFWCTGFKICVSQLKARWVRRSSSRPSSGTFSQIFLYLFRTLVQLEVFHFLPLFSETVFPSGWGAGEQSCSINISANIYIGSTFSYIGTALFCVWLYTAVVSALYEKVKSIFQGSMPCFILYS